MPVTRVRSRWQDGDLIFSGDGKVVFEADLQIDNPIADPGNAGAIPVTTSGTVALVTAGAETRTLAAPTYVGQRLVIYLKTDGGNCVITCATEFNQGGDTTATFADVGDTLLLTAVEVDANIRWRGAVADGAVLA